MSGDDLYMDAHLLVSKELHLMQTTKPPIVCLCGSTRFKDDFIKQNFDFTKRGHIVLTVGWFNHADGTTYSLTDFEKRYLDELHKRKIDLADFIFIVNPGGYIGASTQSEIDYAAKLGKPVYYLEC